MTLQDTWLSALFATIDRKDAQKFSEYFVTDGELVFANLPMIKCKTAISVFCQNFFASIDAIDHQIERYCRNGNEIICHGTIAYTRHDKSFLTVPFCCWLYFNDDHVGDATTAVLNRYLAFVDTSLLY
jgi:hypothetical protein